MRHVQSHLDRRQSAQVTGRDGDTGCRAVAGAGEAEGPVGFQPGRQLGVVGVEQDDDRGLPLGGQVRQRPDGGREGPAGQRRALGAGVLETVDHDQAEAVDTGGFLRDGLRGRLRSGERQGRRPQPAVGRPDGVPLPGGEGARGEPGVRHGGFGGDQAPGGDLQRHARKGVEHRHRLLRVERRGTRRLERQQAPARVRRRRHQRDAPPRQPAAHPVQGRDAGGQARGFGLVGQQPVQYVAQPREAGGVLGPGPLVPGRGVAGDGRRRQAAHRQHLGSLLSRRDQRAELLPRLAAGPHRPRRRVRLQPAHHRRLPVPGVLQHDLLAVLETFHHFAPALTGLRERHVHLWPPRVGSHTSAVCAVQMHV
ncbi:hypothetical protein STAL104432_00480 [Streptomyces albus]